MIKKKKIKKAVGNFLKLFFHFSGVNQCDCEASISPSSLIEPKEASMKFDKRKVCFDFCRFHRITLKGCSPCSAHFLRESDNERRTEHKKEQESDEQENSNIRPGVAVVPPRNPVAFPVRQSMVLQATTDATTPDWNRICAGLCRNGSGGLLCNCDLPPF